MGGLTSKLDEMVNNSKGTHTPKTKRIPFDPRSPSDDITRTPITMLNSPDSGVDTTPTDAKVFRVGDPRSPNDEVTRTPIIIEKKEGPRRPLPLRPNTQMKLDSFLCSTNDDDDNEMQDPRSPTTKVPRTPLEDKVLDLEFDQKEDNDENIETPPVTQENQDKQEESKTLVKKLFPSDGNVDKIRRPLGLVHNTNVKKTPRDLLQAKHCKNVEEEYNKNIHSLLPDHDNTVKTNTEFVENI